MKKKKASIKVSDTWRTLAYKCVELRGGNCGAETEKKEKRRIDLFLFFSNDDALYQPVRSGVSYLYTRLFTAYIFVVSFLVLRSDSLSL